MNQTETKCPKCQCPTDTPALAFLHEQVHAPAMSDSPCFYLRLVPHVALPRIAEVMEAYARQVVARLEADNHRLRLGDMSTFDYERLVEWIKNPERKNTSAAFTAGAARTAATAIQDSGILAAVEQERQRVAGESAPYWQCRASI